MATKTDTLVEISILSDQYVAREELGVAIFNLEEALRLHAKFTEDEITQLLDELNKLEAPKRKERIKGKEQEVENEINVTLKMEAEDLLSIIYESLSDELWDFVAANYDTDAFAEEVKDAGLWPKDFIPAVKFNNAYEFKRYACDLLEVGYHTDDWEIVKAIACYINPDFKVL